MLEQLQNARPEHGSRKSADNSAKRQRGQQQIGALQDMIGRQGRLLDRAQERSSEETARRSAAGLARAHANRLARVPMVEKRRWEKWRGAGGHEDDQRIQRALRRALGELMQQFGDLTGEVPRSLGDADQAMRDAGEALGQGRDGPAGQAEQRAIEALQKGGREMGRQMARQFGRGQSGQGEEGEGSGEAGLGLQDGRGDRDSVFRARKQASAATPSATRLAASSAKAVPAPTTATACAFPRRWNASRPPYPGRAPPQRRRA